MTVRDFSSLCSAWNGLAHYSLRLFLSSARESGIPFPGIPPFGIPFSLSLFIHISRRFMPPDDT